MARRLLRTASLVVTLASLTGCDDDSAPAEPCNELANDAPGVIPEIRSAGTTPMGGTLEDGRYFQTAVSFIPDPGVTLPPDPRTLAAVFSLQAGALEAVVGISLGDSSESDRFSATYTPSGTVLILNYDCPDDSVLERPSYTATPSELRLFYRVADDTATSEIVFTKQ